jgi:hypothetical protein
VGELLSAVVKRLLDRSYTHDLSKTAEPELATFNEVTPRLKTLTYGSDEYRASLAEIRDALTHHYAHNRHHPEHHADGVAGMTLVDVVEMLADWKAATERHTDGDLARSLEIQRDRFHLDPQVYAILRNTALALGWLEEGDDE